MSLPPNEILCRFIRPRKQDWSQKLNLPTPRAFRQKGLSVWHKGSLDKESVSLNQLRMGSLEGAGQAHHTVQDYFDSGKEAESKRKEEEPFATLAVEVFHRPDNVEPPWGKWRDAHYEVEANVSLDPEPNKCLQAFCNLLVAKARFLAPPDIYNDDLYV